MYLRLSRAAHRNGEDAGIGMIMVIGLTGVITVLIGVLFTIVINSLAGANRHQHFDLALTSAESGIDKTLARLQLYYNTGNTTATYTTPSTGLAGFEPTPVCNASVIRWGGPFTGANAQTAERNWAVRAIKSLVAAHPACLQHASKGDFATIAPGPSATGTNPNAVYSMGWSPGYGVNNAKSRLIKAEYLFVPYTPHNAILTAGSLRIESSTTVNGVGSNKADVHSNSTITTIGNPQVTGQMSSTVPSSGGCGNRCGGSGTIDTTPAQAIPTINARNFYSRLALSTPDWYDLCPDGAVHYPSSSTPCTGNTVPSGDAVSVASSGFQGWSFKGSNGDGSVTWEASKSGITLSGTYYVYNGNVTQARANRGSQKITVIAQSVGSSCPKVGGNITWQNSDIPGPSLKGLFFLADADLLITSNFYAGTQYDGGLFLAGDQVEIDTSSDADYGGVIAADQCANGGLGITQNLIKNPVITYLPNVANFFDVVIDTTLWLEYPGA